MSLLTDLPALIHDALVGADILMDLTYTGPSTGGTMVGGKWESTTGGSPLTCKGWIDDDVSRLVPDPSARTAKQRLVGITQPSLSVTPVVQGKVTARGTVHTVTGVTQDSASATWLLLTEV